MFYIRSVEEGRRPKRVVIGLPQGIQEITASVKEIDFSHWKEPWHVEPVFINKQWGNRLLPHQVIHDRAQYAMRLKAAQVIRFAGPQHGKILIDQPDR